MKLTTLKKDELQPYFADHTRFSKNVDVSRLQGYYFRIVGETSLAIVGQKLTRLISENSLFDEIVLKPDTLTKQKRGWRVFAHTRCA